MSIFTPGLVHAPITPFSADFKIDFGLFEKVIEFHLKNGAQALAIQMHTGESVSLSDIEQRKLLEFTIKQVNDRTPVIAHVSDAGTRIAVNRARHAEQAGASAVMATTPYYWTPPPDMLLEHFVQIGTAVKLPFFVFHTPQELSATRLSPEFVVKLIGKLGNFEGFVDGSLEWQFMIFLVTAAWKARPDFQLISASEYMVSAGTIGAKSMFSSLAGVAPTLVRRLYDICRTEKYASARQTQEQIAELRQIVRRAGGICGLKGAMRAMGRDCGQPRPPLETLDAGRYQKLEAEMNALTVLREEPRGW